MKIQRIFNVKIWKNDVSKSETVIAKVHESFLSPLFVLIVTRTQGGLTCAFSNNTNKTTTNTESLTIFEVLPCSLHKYHWSLVNYTPETCVVLLRGRGFEIGSSVYHPQLSCKQFL